MWVLVVIFCVGTGGTGRYATGPAVNFQEFTSKATCEAAQTLVVRETAIVLEKPFSGVKTYKPQVQAMCIQK